MARELTYADFQRTGEQDFGNAGDIHEILQLADSPVDAVEIQRRMLEAEYRQEWIAQQEGDFDGLDPNKAFDAWLFGWIGALTGALKGELAMPGVGPGDMTPEQWLAIRQQRAMSGAWGVGGDEAFERETMVRSAITELLAETTSFYSSHTMTGPTAVEAGLTADQLLQEMREVLADHPGIIRSAQDPAMQFFVGNSTMKGTTVYLLDALEYDFLGEHVFDAFRYASDSPVEPRKRTAQHGGEVIAERLGQMTGVRWLAGITIVRRRHTDLDVPWLRDTEEPLAKRNPKSMMTSSSWTTAREKLRSAAVKQTKKNPWPADHSSVGEVASEEKQLTADWYREHGLSMADLIRDRIEAGDPPDAIAIDPDDPGVALAEGSVIAITKRGTAIVESWDYIEKRSARQEFDMDQIWLDGTDAPNSLETAETTGAPGSRWAAENLTENSAGNKKTGRYGMVMGERRKWRSRGRTWDDLRCAPDCMGYAAFVTSDGVSIQACDECNAAAEEVGLPVLADEDVRHVRGARHERDAMRSMLRQNSGKKPPYTGRDQRGNRLPPPPVERAACGICAVGKCDCVSPRARKKNPASHQLEDAKAKYEEFHAKKPTKVGEFASSFKIPTTIGELGKAVHVLYRSDKKDPVTLKQAKKPVDYIHEHYAGVKCYAVDDELEQVDVPAFIQNADALVLLGLCLGFRFKDDGGEHDAEGSDPLPELYATPCGKALIVVQSKKEVLAMIWGGGLGVWARGIDG